MKLFRFTGHLRGIPRTKASDGELWRFLWCARINGLVNNREAGDLRLRAHYDIIVMKTVFATRVYGPGYRLPTQNSPGGHSWVTSQCSPLVVMPSNTISRAYSCSHILHFFKRIFQQLIITIVVFYERLFSIFIDKILSKCWLNYAIFMKYNSII